VRPLAHLDVGQHAADVHGGPAGHARPPPQHRPGLHRDVRLEHDARLDARAVAHRHAGESPAPHDAREHRPLDLRELLAVVDPRQHVGPQLHGRHALAGVGRERDDVGQVQLPLGVVRHERRQRLAQRRHVGRVDARVDLAHGALLVVAQIAVLAHHHDVAVLAQDAPVAGRVVDDARGERERRRRPALVEGPDHRAQVVAADERDVAVHHEHAHRLPPDRRQPDARRVARAALLLLHRRAHPLPRERPGEIRLEVLAPVADDDDHLSTPRVQGGLHGVVDDGEAGDRVHHLGKRALHSRPLPCRKHDGGRRLHGSPVWLRRVI